jgi:hypothetical protein
MGHGVVAQRPYFVVVGQINPFKNERPIGLQNHPQNLNGPWGKRHRMFLIVFHALRRHSPILLFKVYFGRCHQANFGRAGGG